MDLDAHPAQVFRCTLPERCREGGEDGRCRVERESRARRLDRSGGSCRAANGVTAPTAGRRARHRSAPPRRRRRSAGAPLRPRPPPARPARGRRRSGRAARARGRSSSSRARTGRTPSVRSTTAPRRRRRSGCRTEARCDGRASRPSASGRRGRPLPPHRARPRRFSDCAGCRGAAARRSLPRGSRLPPGTATAGTGGGSCGRSASRRRPRGRAPSRRRARRSRRRRSPPGAPPSRSGRLRCRIEYACLDVQRRRRADHPEAAATHTELPLVDRRRRLDLEPVVDRLHIGVELERHNLAPRFETALDVQHPVARICGRVSS